MNSKLKNIKPLLSIIIFYFIFICFEIITKIFNNYFFNKLSFLDEFITLFEPWFYKFIFVSSFLNTLVVKPISFILLVMFFSMIIHMFLSLITNNYTHFSKTISTIFISLSLFYFFKFIPVIGSFLFILFSFIRIMHEISKDNNINYFKSFFVVLSPIWSFFLFIALIFFSIYNLMLGVF